MWLIAEPRGRRAARRRPIPLVLVAAVASLGLGADVSAQPAPDEVREVGFAGNLTFPDDSLAAAIVTQATECRSRVFAITGLCALGMPFAVLEGRYRERDLELDRTRLTLWYRQRGFLDVAVGEAEVIERDNTVEVLFRVVEGEPVLASQIDFVWLDDVDADEVIEGLPIQEGDRLSTLAREAARDTIVQRLHNRGYAHADVYFRGFRPEQDPNNARVTFEIEPGLLTTYGTIEINGIERLSQGTVRRTLQLNTGDVFRASGIEEARARLFALDIVRSATVVPRLGDLTDSVATVVVDIQEGDAYRMRVGGGMSTAECFAAEARWTSRNFLGGGRLLQVRGRVGNILASNLGSIVCEQAGTGAYADVTGVAAVELFQPWILSTDNSLSMSIFAERQTLPDIFIRRAVGFQAALTRALDRRTALTLFWRPELSELNADDVLFCSGFLVCTPDDIEILEQANRLAPVGINLTRDLSNDLLDPSSGARILLEFEHAAPWTASSFRYNRAVAEATRYERIGSSWVFATRVRAGWVGSARFSLSGTDQTIVHPQRRFFAGGANSVRGFAQSRLGPTVLFAEPEALLSAEGAGCSVAAVIDRSCDAAGGDGATLSELPTGGTRVFEANAELRFPLGSWLEGVAFTDVGQAWGTGDGADLREVEVTPGFGIRFPSPVGPIRIDLAYGPESAEPLAVLAPQIRAFDSRTDDPAERLRVDDVTLDLVKTGELSALAMPVLLADRTSRLQLHVSIGQAF